MKAVLLFSNSKEIEFCALEDSSCYKRSIFHDLVIDKDNWLAIFDSQDGQKMFTKFLDPEFNSPGIFIIYDGQRGEDECDLILDKIKMEILERIRASYGQILIVFHNKPSKRIKEEIINIFGKDKTLYDYNSRHDRNSNSTYYQVYNSLVKLYSDYDKELNIIIKGIPININTIKNLESLIDLVFSKFSDGISMDNFFDINLMCATPNDAKRVLENPVLIAVSSDNLIRQEINNISNAANYREINIEARKSICNKTIIYSYMYDFLHKYKDYNPAENKKTLLDFMYYHRKYIGDSILLAKWDNTITWIESRKTFDNNDYYQHLIDLSFEVNKNMVK